MKGKSLTQVLPKITSLNLSTPDSNSKQHLRSITEDLPVQPNDVYGIVILTTGGIDLVHSYGRSAPRECAMYSATLEQTGPWTVAFRERLTKMLQLISERFPVAAKSTLPISVFRLVKLAKRPVSIYPHGKTVRPSTRPTTRDY